MSSNIRCLSVTQWLRHRYLGDMMKGLNDTKRKYGSLKTIFNVDECKDAIQAYEKRVNDLKMDFLVRVFSTVQRRRSDPGML